VERSVGRSLIAPALAVVGGTVASIGSFLTWADATLGPASFSAKGIDGWEGKATVVGGVLLLVAGISAFVGTQGARERLGAWATIGGLVAAGVGIYTALTAHEQVVSSAADEISRETGISAIARTSIEAALNRGLLGLDLQIGLYLVVAGGVIGLIAGVLAIVARPRRPTDIGPAGLTGWAAPREETRSTTPAPVGGAAAAGEPAGPERSPDRPPAIPRESVSSVWVVPVPPPPEVGSDPRSGASGSSGSSGDPLPGDPASDRGSDG
jgi:hypothetical protein